MHLSRFQKPYAFTSSYSKPNVVFPSTASNQSKTLLCAHSIISVACYGVVTLLLWVVSVSKAATSEINVTQDGITLRHKVYSDQQSIHVVQGMTTVLTSVISVK